MIKMIITTAGRQALINAQQTGTNSVTISHIGVGTGKYTPAASQTALQQEVNRLNIIEGGSAGDNAFHVAYQDESTATYSVYEFGLYLDNGVLFAVYSSNTLLLQKTASTMAMLVVDVALEDISVSQITFGSVSYKVAAATTENAGVLAIATNTDVASGTATQLAVTPANLGARTATETRTGLVELATSTEAKAGTDTARVITPKTAKDIVDNRLATSAEVIAGSNNTKMVTPAGLTARTATTARTGLIRLATEAEALAGTDNTKAITPDTLRAVLDDNLGNATDTEAGLIQLATEAEALAGTNNTKAMTALGVKNAITNFSGNIDNAKVIASTSTTARTLAARFADSITPKDFGATSGGAKDDTAAFTALEAKVKGRMVDLEGLTYLVNAIPTGNQYYNGYFKVGDTTYLPKSFTVNNGALINAEGESMPTIYPSGKSKYYQASSGTNQIAMARFSNDESGNSITFLKGRSGKVNTSKSAIAGDTIGWISFLADNGNVDYTSDIAQGARAGYIEGAVFENSSLSASGTTNLGVRGVIRLVVCSDRDDRSGTGVEVIDTSLRPLEDGVLSLGTAGRKYKSIYATTDVISTSDKNLKQDIEPISDKVLEAWGKVNFKQFRLKDDTSLIYFGAIAQEIISAFESVGLNALDYGIVSEETTDDGTTTYGVRYRDAMVLEAEYQRKRIAELEARISALEEV